MPLTTKSNLWPSMLAGLLGLFLIFTFWSIKKAVSDVSAVTDRDYYSHGLRYEDSQIEQRAALSLGWQSRARLEGRLLLVELLDAGKQPVTGALAEFSVGGAGDIPAMNIPLAESSPGLYSAQLPEAFQGEIRASLQIHRQGAKLHKSLLLSL